MESSKALWFQLWRRERKGEKYENVGEAVKVMVPSSLEDVGPMDVDRLKESLQDHKKFSGDDGLENSNVRHIYLALPSKANLVTGANRDDSAAPAEPDQWKARPGLKVQDLIKEEDMNGQSDSCPIIVVDETHVQVQKRNREHESASATPSSKRQKPQETHNQGSLGQPGPDNQGKPSSSSATKRRSDNNNNNHNTESEENEGSENGSADYMIRKCNDVVGQHQLSKISPLDEELLKPFTISGGPFDGKQFPRNICHKAVLDTSVDLRLPQHNPFLYDGSPLFEMKNDICEVLKLGQVQYPVMVGSSGVGKTTTAFLVAKDHFCIYLEAGTRAKEGAGYSVVRHRLEADVNRGVNRQKATMDDIRRRVFREVAARLFLLITLRKKKSQLTPYEWLVFQLGDTMQAVVDGVLGAFAAYDIDYRDMLLKFQEALGEKITVILDEAHMWNDDSELNGVATTYADAGKSYTFFQAVLHCFGGVPKVVNGVLSLGTQVGMEEAHRVVADVAKREQGSRAYIFGKFPILRPRKDDRDAGPLTVLSALSACLDISKASNVMVSTLEYQLQGRSRFVSSFVTGMIDRQVKHSRESDPNTSETSTDNLLSLGLRSLDFIAVNSAIRSVITLTVDKYDSGKRIGLGQLMDIVISGWLDKEHLKASLYDFHTLICTEGVDLASPIIERDSLYVRNDYTLKTGMPLLAIGRNDAVPYSFHYDEPILSEQVRVYLKGEFRKRKNDDFADQIRTHYFTIHGLNRPAQVRGQALDEMVLLQLLLQDEVKQLGSMFDLRKGHEVEKATFNVTRVLNGPGMLVQWLDMVLNPATRHTSYTGTEGDVGKPDAWINAVVKPDHYAGADVVFAALDKDGKVVIVSIGCAWYSDREDSTKVNMQKWKCALQNQYNNDSRIQSVADCRSCLEGQLNQYKGRFRELWVSVELPKRASMKEGFDMATRHDTQPATFEENPPFHGEWKIVDESNAEKILGIKKKWVDNQQAPHVESAIENGEGN